jgi:hypothetical protein
MPREQPMSWEARIKLSLAVVAVLGGTGGLGVVWGETKALLRQLVEISADHERRIDSLERGK